MRFLQVSPDRLQFLVPRLVCRTRLFQSLPVLVQLRFRRLALAPQGHDAFFGFLQRGIELGLEGLGPFPLLTAVFLDRFDLPSGGIQFRLDGYDPPVGLMHGLLDRQGFPFFAFHGGFECLGPFLQCPTCLTAVLDLLPGGLQVHLGRLVPGLHGFFERSNLFFRLLSGRDCPLGVLARRLDGIGQRLLTPLGFLQHGPGLLGLLTGLSGRGSLGLHLRVQVPDLVQCLFQFRGQRRRLFLNRRLLLVGRFSEGSEFFQFGGPCRQFLRQVVPFGLHAGGLLLFRRQG